MKRFSIYKILLVVGVFTLSGCLKEETRVSFEEQLFKDVQAIDDYLAANAISAIEHASGLRIKIDQMGSGVPALLASNVKVKYTGKLLSSGATFDNGEVIGTSSQYIYGWQLALFYLPPGTKATIYIPSGYAYGTSGSGSIPPNANLIFDIEIVSVSFSTNQQNQINTDAATIDTHLTNNNITAEVHSSGFRYVINQVGEGPMPTWFTKVRFKYVGKLLNGTQFNIGTAEPQTGFDNYVTDQFLGLKLGLQLLPVGSKATFYFPSTLAFGSQSSGTLPANSNVIYEVELLEIVQ